MAHHSRKETERYPYAARNYGRGGWTKM